MGNYQRLLDPSFEAELKDLPRHMRVSLAAQGVGEISLKDRVLDKIFSPGIEVCSQEGGYSGGFPTADSREEIRASFDQLLQQIEPPNSSETEQI